MNHVFTVNFDWAFTESDLCDISFSNILYIIWLRLQYTVIHHLSVKDYEVAVEHRDTIDKKK